MSQPKRFIVISLPPVIQEDEQGYFVSWDDYAALAAENERLRSKLSFSQSISEICKHTHEGETVTVQGSISSGKTVLTNSCQCERLTAENEVLRKKVDWLMKADRLVIWNGTEWQVRHVVEGEKRDTK